MKTLLILRHAEAMPPGASGSDHQRVLTEAGLAQARRLGSRLRERGLPVDRVISSSAARAVQTAEAVIERSGLRVPLSVTEMLYNAPAASMLEVLAEQPDSDGQVLLVAHMPGVAELAEALATSSGKGALHFQPGMLAVVTLDVEHWSDIHPGCGTIQTWLPP